MVAGHVQKEGVGTNQKDEVFDQVVAKLDVRCGQTCLQQAVCFFLAEQAQRQGDKDVEEGGAEDFFFRR
jgi:hypothetical protein